VLKSALARPPVARLDAARRGRGFFDRVLTGT